eukprot:m51a1_g596 hypothetical protein (1087) ;mRNA; r:58019-62162
MSTGYDFKTLEPEVRQFWQEHNIYAKAKEAVQAGPKYYFLDGPPYTSGKVHLGTAWNKSLKDMFVRYKRMSGCNVWDRAGYDMHGLPTEKATERELNIFGKDEILKYGRDLFIDRCKEICVRNAVEMSKVFSFMGVWMDFDNAYLSVSPEYIDGIWWFVKRAHEENRLYEAEKTMTWDAVNGTALAKHELEYKHVKDTAIFVRFAVQDDKMPSGDAAAPSYLVIWTTTPWTIPFNLAVMVNPELEYVKVLVTFNGQRQHWYVATARIEPFLKGQLAFSDADFQVVWRGKGKELFGIAYEHPFAKLNPVYGRLKATQSKIHTVVLSAQFVDTEAGTGLVHCAPGCGPEDYVVGQENGIKPFNTTGEDGVLRDLEPMTGLRARLDDPKFIELIEQQGSLVHSHFVEHDYPHGERSKGPVIFRTTKQWFMHVEDLRQKLLDANEKITWAPQAAKNAFTAWLQNLRDNSISKQRFWGTPLPIWRNVDDQSDYIVVGSAEELCQLAGIDHKLEDLHPPTVDKIVIERVSPKDGKKHSYRRVPDVLDVWVDAGSASWNCLRMPPSCAQPTQSEWMPAQFILEGRDQIRGWFNLLHLESMVATGKPCFNSVYMHGFINDSQGRKMSKSLGNYILPDEVWSVKGVDTLRYFMIGSAPPGSDMSFNPADVEIKYNNLRVFWNIHNYVQVTAEAADVQPVPLSQLDPATLGQEERYILSRLNATVRDVTAHLDAIRLNMVPLAIEEFLLELSRVYIQLIWEKKDTGTPADKVAVVSTLAHCMATALSMFAIVCPFVSERMYRNLREALPGLSASTLAPESVHLTRWPVCDAAMLNPQLEADISAAKDAIAAILAAREKANLAVKQPSREVRFECPPQMVACLQRTADVIRGRTNVKALSFEPVTAEVSVGPNQKTLGKQFGRDRAKVIAAIDNCSAQLCALVAGKGAEDSWSAEIATADGASKFTVTEQHVVVTRSTPKQYAPGKSGEITALVDTTRTEELELEGRMRELARLIQVLRKEASLKRTDKVRVELALPEQLAAAAKANADWLRDRTGASEVVITVAADPESVEKQRKASVLASKVEKLGKSPVAVLLG